jgi:hypothetical protein
MVEGLCGLKGSTRSSKSTFGDTISITVSKDIWNPPTGVSAPDITSKPPADQ